MFQRVLSNRRAILRSIGYSLTAGIIFLSGWGIGSNRIVLNSDQLFRKSVQKNSPENLDYSSVEQVYDVLRRDYDGQLDVQKMLDGLKTGLVSSAGDTYTEYLNKEAAKEFDDQLSGSFTGIGAELTTKDKYVMIEVPLAGFPAEKAGLRAKDIIVEINGKDAVDIGVREAVKQIRGEAGTTVKLKIVRDGKEELDFEITRAKITVPSVKSEILEGNIGYLKLNSRFGPDTVELARKSAEEFRSANVRGIILDVRNNPGGLLDAAVKVSNLWLDKGQTILQERRDGVVIKTFRAPSTPILKGIPAVVLINEGSASASEIVAGALHDNKAAKLIGEKSFGKGSVQQLEELPDGGVLKVTIARWYTPAGVNINKEGIKPDLEVKLTDEDTKAKRDPQLDAAKASFQ